MRRPVSLNRLSEISKQRSIRRPLLVPVSADHAEDGDERPATKVEWPVPN